MISPVVQRWREGRDSYRPAGEPFDPRGWSVEAIADDTTPKAFVAAHHYLGTLPPTRRRFGLYAPGGALSGVAVFCVPSRVEVLSPLPGGLEENATLGRFVLLDDVRANSESWFLARALEALKREGFAGVVSFSDPNPRTDAEGRVVFKGHIGNIYQALGARFLGQREAETVLLLPSGRTFDRRTLAKARSGERGQRYAVAQLVAAGAPEPSPRQSLSTWVERWLPRVTRKVRQAGTLKYVFPLAEGAKRDVKRAVGAGLPYVKLCDVGLCTETTPRHRPGCVRSGS